MQCALVFGYAIPQLALLAWFSQTLVTAIRNEHAAAASIRSAAAERERLELEVLEAGERESRRIGGDLHDGVCQDLTSLLLLSKRSQKRLQTAGRPEAEMLGDVVQGLGEAIGEIHGLSRRLSPGSLRGRDLAGVIEDQVHRAAEAYEATIVFHRTGASTEMEPGSSLQLYRIAQEALANAVRHSGAERIEVVLKQGPTEVILRVDDHGRGLSQGQENCDGLGLKTMEWRASKVGGSLSIGHRPGGGTRVECRIPLDTMRKETFRGT